MIRFLLICLFGLLLANQLPGEIILDQAVSWTDFSYITSIAAGFDMVYFGTTEGILRYNRLERRWYEPITVSDGLPDRYIRRLALYPDGGRLAFETESGVYSYDYRIKSFFPESEFPEEFYQDPRPPTPLPTLIMPFGYAVSPEGTVSDAYFRDFRITAWLNDFYGMIYAGTWGLGPILIDTRTYEATIIPFGLIQKRTDVIYREGDSLWLAGNQGDYPTVSSRTRRGVTLFRLSEPSFAWLEPRYLNGFNSEIIYDIAGDKKRLYFAGSQGMTILRRGDGRFFTITRREGLPETEVTALAVRSDSVWIGTTAGLALYTPSVDTVTIVSRKFFGDLFITDLVLTGDRLIIGSTNGAWYIDFRSREVGRLRGDAVSGEIRHLAVADDELLVSTNAGVGVVNLVTEKITVLPYIDQASGAYAAAANEFYYAVAVDDGLTLIRRDDTQRWRHFTTDDGLLSDRVNALLPDGDYLWIGSEEGLTRFKWVNPDRVD